MSIFFQKKGIKNFTTLYSISFLGDLDNEALHNFHKRGSRLGSDGVSNTTGAKTGIAVCINEGHLTYCNGHALQ